MATFGAINDLIEMRKKSFLPLIRVPFLVSRMKIIIIPLWWKWRLFREGDGKMVGNRIVSTPTSSLHNLSQWGSELRSWHYSHILHFIRAKLYTDVMSRCSNCRLLLWELSGIMVMLMVNWYKLLPCWISNHHTIENRQNVLMTGECYYQLPQE